MERTNPIEDEDTSQKRRISVDTDVIVIGGGIVGLAILHSITSTTPQIRCILVESSPDLLSQASGSNTGIICTGVDASPGTLERALIRDSISLIRGFCKEMHVPLVECGSLVCLWPWDGPCDEDASEEDGYEMYVPDKRLLAVAQESWDAGDTHAKILSPRALLHRSLSSEHNQGTVFEPNISPSCCGAVHIPGEIVVDPWLFGIAMASRARQGGGVIYTGWTYDPEQSSFSDGIWTITRRTADGSEATDENPSILRAKLIVNCTGIQSDVVQALTKDAPPPTWEARPRRGQYLVFAQQPQSSQSPLSSSPSICSTYPQSSKDSNNVAFLTHPIQPVPTQRTKGVFIFRTLYDQNVVGPTAADQNSRTDNTPDSTVRQLLWDHGRRVLPTLDDTGDI